MKFNIQITEEDHNFRTFKTPCLKKSIISGNLRQLLQEKHNFRKFKTITSKKHNFRKFKTTASRKA